MFCLSKLRVVLILALATGCLETPAPPRLPQLVIELRDPAAVRKDTEVRLVEADALADALAYCATHTDLSVSLPESIYREFFEALGTGKRLSVDQTGRITVEQFSADQFVVACDGAHLWVVPVRNAPGGTLVLTDENQGGTRAFQVLTARSDLSRSFANRLRREAVAVLGQKKFDAARSLATNARAIADPDKAAIVLTEINQRQASDLLAGGEAARLRRDYRAARNYATEASTFLAEGEREPVEALLRSVLEDEGGELFAVIGHTGPVTSVTLWPDGKLIASAGEDTAVKLWDAATGKEVRTFSAHHAAVRTVVLSSDGRRLLSAGDDGLIVLWDTATGEELKTFDEHGWKVTCADLSASGAKIVGGSEDHHVKVWDVASGRQTESLRGHGWKVTAVAFTPDERRVMSGSDDQTLRLWDLATGAELQTMQNSFTPVKALAISGDGRFAVSGGDDKLVKVWDLATGRELFHLDGHSGPVTSVHFSPDGQYILSGSADNTVKLWRLDTRMEVATFSGHTQPVRSVAFSSDGRRAASAGADGTVRCWQLPRVAWPAAQQAKN